MTSPRPSDPFLSLGFAGIDWMEHYLVHGPGDVQGQMIDLDDEFAAFIVKSYRVDRRGERLVRRAFLSRAKGRSKSGLAAMMACFEALGPCRFDHFAEEGEVSAWGYEYEPGEPVGKPLTYAEILNVATEEGQAGNTYDAIYYMLSPETCSPELVRDYGKVDVGLTRTNLPDKRGFIQPVSSADSSADGGKSTFIVADETHLWILPRLKRLHGIMTRNLLKRKVASGWMLETSTMYGEGEDSVAEGTHAYATSRRKDRTLLFDHRQAAATWNLNVRAERMKALREAYGPAAAWMNLDAICDSWNDPQVSESEFRRYWLNQPVATIPVAPAVIDYQKWVALTDAESTADEWVAFGIDTTPNRAWTSLAAVGIREDGAPHVEVIDHRQGTAWTVKRCVELNDKHGPAPFVMDSSSPAASMIDDLEAAGIDVIVLSITELGRACAWLVDAVNDEGVLWHGPDGLLEAAVLAVGKKDIGDGLFRFIRLGNSADLSPVMAVTAAAHVLPTFVPLDDVSISFL